MRASVIRTLEGSEVIVPNGQLVSEEVLNWTRSDQQRRLEINVGVAYGTDPEVVIELLTGMASKHADTSRSLHRKRYLSDLAIVLLISKFEPGPIASSVGYKLRAS